MGCGHLHLCDAQCIFVPKAEELAIISAGMLLWWVDRTTPQRMDTLMINGFLDIWKMFWHGISYNSELLLKSHSTYRSIRRITDLLPFQWEFPSPNNLLYCRNKNFIYMEIKKEHWYFEQFISVATEKVAFHRTCRQTGNTQHSWTHLVLYIYFMVMLGVLSHEALKFTEDHL